VFDLVTVDVGNTNIAIAYFLNGEIQKKESKKTKYVSSRLRISSADKIILSSVVPKVTEIILKKYPLAEVVTLQSLDNTSFPLNIGIDRALNCVTAMSLYKTKDVLVIDLGTALTFTCCNNGKFKGGLIMPGYGTAKKVLSQNTALLPAEFDNVEINIFNVGTKDAMSAGVRNLYLLSIEALIIKYKSSIKDLVVVLTGGDSLVFAEHINQINIVNPTLLLEGLFLLAK